MDNKFTWSETIETTDDQIKLTEEKLKVALPDDFKAISSKYGGGKPYILRRGEELDLYISVDTDAGGPGEEIPVNLLFSINNDSDSITNELDEGIEGLPKGCIPIAMDFVGNYFCYDYRKTSQSPPIVLWDHEYNKCYPVAKSFTEMLQRLHIHPEERE